MPLSVYKSGGFEGNYTPITLGNPGLYNVKWSYQNYDIPDHVTFRYNGKILLDTGFVNGSNSGVFKKLRAGPDGGKFAAVVATNNPQTQWNYQLQFDAGPDKPEANPDKGRTEKQDNGTRKVVLDLAGNDSSTIGLNLASIAITNQPQNGKVTINADGTVTYITTKAGRDTFFYTIKDKDGNVSEAAKVTVLGDCPDPAPIAVRGPLHHFDNANFCVGTGAFYIGRQDGDDTLLEIDGRVSVFEDRVEVRDALIKPKQVFGLGSGLPLFRGDLTLPARTLLPNANPLNAAVTESSFIKITGTGPGDVYRLGGLLFTPTKLQLAPDALNVMGTFILPDALGATTIELSFLNSLVFDAKGVHLGGGKISLPNHEFKLWTLKVASESVSIEYQAVQDLLKFQGKFTLTTSLVKEEQTTYGKGAAVVLDFLGTTLDPNYLQVKNGIADMKGSFAVQKLVAKGGYGLDELKLTLQTDNGSLNRLGLDGKITLPWPKLPGQDPLKFTFGAQVLENPQVPGDWGLTGFNFGVETLDLPLPFAPSFWLQNANLTISGLRQFDPADISIAGGLKFTLGSSKIKVKFDVPEWLGGLGADGKPISYEVAPATIDLSTVALSVEKLTGAFKLTAAGSITVLHEDVLKISVSELSGNFQTSTFKFIGGVTMLLGSITGAVTGVLVLNDQPSITATGSVSGNLPKSQLLGKFSAAPLASANFFSQLTINDNPADDFEAFWTKASIYVPGIGKTVDFTYGYKQTHPYGLAAPPSFSLILSAKDVPIVGSWDTTAGQPWLMMTKEWTNEINDHVPVRVMWRNMETGESRIFTEYEFEANGIAIVTELTNSFAKTVVVGEPIPGRWDILLPDPGEGFDFGATTESGFAQQPDAIAEFDSAGTDGTSFSLDFRGGDLPDGATISFYWDQDGDGFDGTLIKASLALGTDFQTLNWTPSDLEDLQGDGRFNVYAVINQPLGFPVLQYVPFDFAFPGEVDLAVERSDWPAHVANGQYFNYVLTLHNTGSGVIPAAMLSEVLDGAVIDDVYLGGDGSWDRLNPGEVTIHIGTLNPGDSYNVYFSAHADRSYFHGTRTDPETGDDITEVPGISAEAHVQATGMEHNYLNNSAYAAADYAAPALDPSADIKVERLFHTPTDGSIGTVRYDLVITNQGPGNATAIHLTEAILGGEVAGFFARPLSGNFNQVHYAGQTLTLDIASLGSGDKYILPVSFHAIEAAPLTLWAQTEHAEADIDHRNDFAIDHLDATALGDEPGAVDLALRIGSVTEGADGLLLVRIDLIGEGRVDNIASDMQVRLSTGSGLSLLGTDGRNPLTEPADTSFPTYDPATGVWSLNGAVQGGGQVRSINLTLRKDTAAGGVLKAELIGLREHDLDSTPGNGDPTEDDEVITTLGTPNRAPSLNSLIPDVTVSEGEQANFRVPAGTFLDPDGDPIGYTAIGLPDWLRFDRDTGLFTGVAQPDPQDEVQGYSITVTAFDNRGGLTSDTFRLAVNDIRNAPTPNKHYVDATAYVGVNFLLSLPSNVPYDDTLAYFTDGDLYRTIPGTYTYNHYSYQFTRPGADAPSWLGFYGGAIAGTPTEAGAWDITVVGRNHYYDGQDLDGTQTFRLTVYAIEPPVVAAQIAPLTGTEGLAFAYTVPVSAFTDPNGDALGYWWTGLPTWLNYNIETGALSGTPGQGDVGDFDAVLHATDGKLGVAAQSVHFSVANINDAPQAGPDAFALLPGGIVVGKVGLNDTDRDADPLTWSLAAGPTQGSLTLNADGSFTYVARADAAGADFFTYTASDGQLSSLVTRVDLFLQGGVTGNADSYAARMNVTPDPWTGSWGNRVLTVDADHGVLANDPVFPNAIFREAELVDGPQHGTLTLNPDGSFSYRAANDFFGTDGFTYRDWDGLTHGAPVAVTITVPFENRAAAGQFDIVNGNQNADNLPAATVAAPLTFSTAILLRNDNARDGEPLHFVLVSPTKNGTLVDNGDGTLTYTPDAGFRGSDRFIYNPWDPHGPGIYNVTAVIVVSAPDAFIDARDDTYSTQAGTALTVNARNGVIRNDADPDTSQLWAGDGNGLYYDNVLLVTGPAHGTLEYFNGDGSFRYTPEAGFTGTDSFVYRSAENNRPNGDGDQNPDRATVSIIVGGTDPTPAPVAVADSYNAVEDTVLRVDVAHGVLANDQGAPGHTLVAELVSQTTLGRVILSPYGNFRYEPATSNFDGTALNLNGPDAFTYRVWDGSHASDPVTVVLNVQPAPDVPRAPDLYDYTSQVYGYQPQGQATGYGAGQPDRDGAVSAVNGSAANVGVFVQGLYGRFFMGPGGAYLYQPDFALAAVHAAKPGEQLEDLFTYTWTNVAGSATGTYHGIIQGVDDATIGMADVYQTAPNVALNIHAEDGVLANDYDIDGNIGGATLISGPANGTLAFATSGAFVYTPRLGFVGDDVFSYRPTTASGADAATQVTIRVQPLSANTPPVTRADAYAMVGAGPLVVSAAAGVLANDSDAQGDPFIAQLVSGPAHGTLSLAQDGGFTYRAASGFAGSDSFTYKASDGQALSAAASVTIAVPVNHAPVAGNASLSTAEDTPLLGGLAALVGDIDGDALAFAQLVAPAHGSLRLAASGAYTYTPAADYFGTDSFTYSVDDGRDIVGGRVDLTITPVNDAPTVGRLGYLMEEDGLLSVQPPGPLAFAGDVDGDALSFVLIAPPSVGSFTSMPNGGFTYRPPANFFGSVDFSFAVSDGQLQSATVLGSITVLPQNDPPAAMEDDVTTPFNTAILIPVLANDTDTEGDPLTTVLRSLPASGTAVLQADGSVLYTPNPGFRGTDGFSYSASDGIALSVIAPVVIVVQPPPNIAPIAHDDSAVTNEDTPVTIDVLANDVPGDDDRLTISILEARKGSVIILGDNRLLFTPNPDANGFGGFTYRIDDGQAHADAVVTVAIAPVPDAPVAYNDYVGVAYNTPTTVNPLEATYDGDADPLIVTIEAGPQHGSLVPLGGGQYTYTPTAGFSGEDSLLYSVFDGGLRSGIARVTLQVAARNNHPPAARDGAETTLEDTPLATSLAGLVQDPDRDPLAWSVVTGPAHGSLALNAQTGAYTYTPGADYNGDDAFTYAVSDGLVTAQAVLRITVIAQNDPPVVQDEQVSTPAGVPIEIDVLANDRDPERGPLSLLIAVAPLGGNAVVTADHTILFQPAPGFDGNASLTYRVTDAGGASTNGNLLITVVPSPNHAPVAVDQAFTIDEDNNFQGNLVGYSSDADADPLAARLTALPGHGSVQFERETGKFTYTPEANYHGADSFGFAVKDPDGAEGRAVVSFTINSVNDAPLARLDQARIDEDNVAEGNVLANDLDVDGDPLTARLAEGTLTDTALGHLDFSADGNWRFTPRPNATGTAVFTTFISDGLVESPSTLTIVVQAVNDAPVAGDDAVAAGYGVASRFSLATLLANDTDVDSAPLFIIHVGGGVHGTAAIDGNDVVFTPEAGFSGEAGFDYTLSDGALSDQGHVQVAVAPLGGNVALRFSDGVAAGPRGSSPAAPLTAQPVIDQNTTITPGADGGRDVLETGPWGSIRNLELTIGGGAAAGAWSVRNLAALYADFGGPQPATAPGIGLTAIGLKGGVVDFGDGADSITWVAHSAGGEAGFAEQTALSTRGGDDAVRLFTTASSALDEAMLAGHDNGAAWNPGYDGALSSFTLYLGDGRDTLWTVATDRMRIDVDGGGGNDDITTAAGDDTLRGGSGDDTMAGGAGNDIYVLDSAGDVVVEAPGGGIDTAFLLADHPDAVGPNIEIIRLAGGAAQVQGGDTAAQIVANPGLASSIAGGAGDDVLWGSALANTLSGGAGDDIIRSQGGGGVFLGGDGNDQFVIANPAAVIVEGSGAGSGIDTAWLTADGYTVADNVEIIRLAGLATQVTGGNTPTQIVANPTLASALQGGTGDDVLWGSGFADTLNGGAGHDIFRGQGGADVMIGGLGNDQFVVLDPGVQIIENAGEGYDTAWIGLAANTPFTLAANVERGNLSGLANMLTGNALDNVLVGDAVASVLDGRDGNDLIFASAFADVLTGGTGDDDIYGYGGADRFVYAGTGWGHDRIATFSQGDGARLDFRGSGIGFGQLGLSFGGGNTQVTLGSDSIEVFGATLREADFLFG